MWFQSSCYTKFISLFLSYFEKVNMNLNIDQKLYLFMLSFEKLQGFFKCKCQYGTLHNSWMVYVSYEGQCKVNMSKIPYVLVWSLWPWTWLCWSFSINSIWNWFCKCNMPLMSYIEVVWCSFALIRMPRRWCYLEEPTLFHRLLV